MERFDASNQMVWYAFEEFFVNATPNTSLFFYSKGTKVRAVTAISNIVDPPDGKVLVRAEVYASDKEMINTIALHQLRRGNWDGISLLQSEGNRWSDSKAFDIDLIVIFPKNMRRIGQGETEDARPFLSNLRSEGINSFVTAEDLLFGDVFINSTSDLRIRVSFFQRDAAAHHRRPLLSFPMTSRTSSEFFFLSLLQSALRFLH